MSDIVYLTNTGERVTSANVLGRPNWFWPIDTHNNVLVDPESLAWTKDTWEEFKRQTDERVSHD